MHIFFICIFEELRYMIICCTMLLLKMWEDQIFSVFMIKRGIFYKEVIRGLTIGTSEKQLG